MRGDTGGSMGGGLRGMVRKGVYFDFKVGLVSLWYKTLESNQNALQSIYVRFKGGKNYFKNNIKKSTLYKIKYYL
jgi:hypothetical protein